MASISPGAAHQAQVRGLGHAHAVLGADRAAQLGGQLQHRDVHASRRRGRGPARSRARCRRPGGRTGSCARPARGLHHPGTRVTNSASRASGTPTSILCATPCAAMASVCASRNCHRRARDAVSSATTASSIPAGLERGGQLLGGVAAGRALQHHVGGRARRHRRLAVQVLEHQRQPVVGEEVGRLQRRQLAAQHAPACPRRRPARPAGSAPPPAPARGHQPPAHGGDHAERALAAHQQGGQRRSRRCP